MDKEKRKAVIAGNWKMNKNATSQLASLTAGISSSIRAAASVAFLFIFQLPAMTALRFALSILVSPYLFPGKIGRAHV